MEAITNPTTGEMELWVPHGTDEVIVQKAVKFFTHLGFTEEKKHIIIYRSGAGDVAALTCALLKQNRG